MNIISVNIAKTLMKMFPSEPVFKPDYSKTEILNHKEFIEKDEKGKDEILYKMSLGHFLENEKKPFQHYFKKYDFKKLLCDKRVLDLGCGCGGKAVSNAEAFGIREMYGTDIKDYFIRAANNFALSRENKSIRYDFRKAYGEKLPFEDNFFDAILSMDVFEHVQSLEETISECKRVLKPGGHLFAVFPSYFTIGESHMGLATKMPIIQWLFSSETIGVAYYEILKDRGDRAYWYFNVDEKPVKWKKYNAGIGINGTTFKKYKKIINKNHFKKIDIIPTPFLSVGGVALKYPLIKYFSKILYPFVLIPYIQDFFSHRIVSVLIKK